MIFILLFLIFLITSLFTYWLINYAKKKSLVDIPNKRSSHTLPTPRGGGIAFVIVFCLVGAIFSILNEIYNHLYILIGFFSIAVLGFIDDKNNLSFIIRIFFQLIVLLIVIYFLGWPKVLNIFGFKIHNILIKSVITILSVIWMINLFNFMDGIDGIASIEAISILSGLFLLNYFFYSKIVLLPIFLLLAILGFLIWNWHPAKIFMGDVGSASLGFLFGIWALYSKSLFNMDFTSFHLLIIVFTLDATVTLFRRLFAGQKITQAHKLHFYQRAVQSGWKHSTVSMITAFLNIFVIAGVFLYLKDELLLGTLIAVFPIIIFFFVVEKRRPFKVALQEHSALD